jgi:hypothetical protein
MQEMLLLEIYSYICPQPTICHNNVMNGNQNSSEMNYSMRES